jgi:hypothetical protein
MTWYSSKDVAYVFIDNLSVAPYLNAMTMKTSAVLANTTGFGDTWTEWTDTGLRNGEVTMGGFYDGGTDGAAMNTVAATDRTVSVLLEGNTVSKRFYLFQSGLVSSTEIGLSPEGVHTSAPGYTVTGEVNFGYVVAPYAARTTAGNTDAASCDVGAGGIAAGHCVLHVAALTLGGYDNCVVTLRSDADNEGVFTDETAFTAVTAVGSEVKALATGVDRYMSVSWAWTGEGTGQSISFFVGVAADA